MVRHGLSLRPLGPASLQLWRLLLSMCVRPVFCPASGMTLTRGVSWGWWWWGGGSSLVELSVGEGVMSRIQIKPSGRKASVTLMDGNQRRCLGLVGRGTTDLSLYIFLDEILWFLNKKTKQSEKYFSSMLENR